MADQKLSALSEISEGVGDPVLDRLYYYFADGATDADKSVAITPFDLFTMIRRKYFSYFIDGIFNNYGAWTSGAGAETRLYTFDTNSNEWGCIRVQTGTDTTGYAVAATADSSTAQLRPVGKKIRTLGWVATENNISDATDRFHIIHGFTADFNNMTPDNCIYIRYIDNVNSGKWQLVCRSGGSETAQDLGVTVAVATKYRMEIDIDGDAPSVRARVDGGSWSTTITTNIPTNVTDMWHAGVAVRKSAGTATRVAFCMGWGATVEFASAR